MRKHFILKLFLLFSVFSSTPVFGVPNLPSFTMWAYSESDSDSKQEKDLGSERRREVPLPINCVITENGIQTDTTILGILSYEIWDENGETCLASFIDEFRFINAVFSLSEGSYQIRLETTDTIYSGTITIY